MNLQETKKLQELVALEVMKHVPFDGVSWVCVEQEIERQGYNRQYAKALYPDKLGDVLLSFSRATDHKMLEALGNVPEEMRVRDRISHAVMARLSILRPYREAIKQTTAYLSFPTRKPLGARILWSVSDEIWRWAGDTSQDYNYYSKRTLLSGVLGSTMVVWLSDETQNMDATKQFLDARIENILAIGKRVGPVVAGVFSRRKRT